MLLASGEQIGITAGHGAERAGLPCHQPDRLAGGLPYRPCYTNARITRLETERISSELERNRVVVVAGFQGINQQAG